jgi:hypothetical protein
VATALELARAALGIWATLPVAYPLQWAARLPLLEALVVSDDVDGAAEQARALLDPAQQPLAAAAEDALRQGLALYEAGDAAPACAAFARAVASAESGVPDPASTSAH